MTDRLPDAEFLRNLAKDMGLELADQDELDRLNEIADGLEWRPIDHPDTPISGGTARTRLLLNVEGHGVTLGYIWDSGHGRRWATADWISGNITVKHWRQLPAPPVGTGEV